MSEIPYQVNIVGQDTIPQGRKRRWDWLEDQARSLKDGQALRLVIPKDEGLSTVISAWSRTRKRLKLPGASLSEKQGDGSTVLFLWIKTKDYKRR